MIKTNQTGPTAMSRSQFDAFYADLMFFSVIIICTITTGITCLLVDISKYVTTVRYHDNYDKPSETDLEKFFFKFKNLQISSKWMVSNELIQEKVFTRYDWLTRITVE